MAFLSVKQVSYLAQIPSKTTKETADCTVAVRGACNHEIRLYKWGVQKSNGVCMKTSTLPRSAASSFSWQSQLGPLGDPYQYTGTFALGSYTPARLIEALKDMLRIRIVEEIIADMALAGHVKCPVHLAIGQEAVAVGVAAYLRTTDRGFGSHRSHSHYLAMGGDVRKLFAEVLGKATGCSHGFGGSMHLTAKESGFWGSIPIVAGTIPLAVGAGLAAKFDKKGDIAIAFFGDGACEEGVFHECLNMAASMNIPVAFVVENNLFSSHLDINLRQPSDRIARFAEASCMDHVTVDGNDVVAVMQASQRLVELARTQNKPVLIEGITYRWRGHVGPHEDIDVGLRRSPEEVNAWKARDPVNRLLQSLIQANAYTAQEFEAFEANTRCEYKQLSVDVMNDPWPQKQSLMDNVYDR